MAYTPFNDVSHRLAVYCRIDEPLHEDDALLLEDMYHAAVGELASQGVEEPEAGDANIPRRALYNSCIDYLVLSMWDLRAAVVDKAMVENPAFTSKMNRLRLDSACRALSQPMA